MVWRLLFYREIHLFSIMKPKMTLVNFHHISHPMRNVIFLHQRYILYNLLFERLTRFLFYCVPTPQINYHRNGNVVFQYFISCFFTFIDKHEMLVKVFKTKDFYKISLCSNDTHSTWDELIELMHLRFIAKRSYAGT